MGQFEFADKYALGVTSFSPNYAISSLIMKNQIVTVIPARMGSSRFPGKPLAPLLGRPMIEHVLKRAEMCRKLNAVYVATCDEEIKRTVERLGNTVIMTSSSHERASDRVAEAVERIDADIVVMVQGDEPMITPEMIAAAIDAMVGNESIECVNLVCRIKTREEYLDPNTIKVVMNTRREALYFSRAPIPAINPDALENISVFKQVCVIPFRRDFLRRFTSWPPTVLEQAESIDMLRILEHGERVHLVETNIETHSVDTPEDLRLVEYQMQNDPLIRLYSAASAL